MEFSSEEQSVISEAICCDDAVIAKRIKMCSRSMPLVAVPGLVAIAAEIFGAPLSGSVASFSIASSAMLFALLLFCRASLRFQRTAFSVIRKLHREE